MRDYLKNNDISIKDGTDVNSIMRDMMSVLLEGALDEELDEELGYSKYDYRNKETDNSRNGHSSKTMHTSYGDMDVAIPRDRNGDYEPQLIKKYQNTVTQDMEEKILSMYAKGMTTGDIESHMRELYDIDISDSTISRITDKILPIVKEWQERPLEEVYAVVFMDAIHYHVRSEGRIVKRAVYIALGIDMNGKKDVLGMYVGENESAKFWLSIMNGLKNRGVEDILIACVDGLNGFPQAIEAVYPKTEIQQCIIHQIRNSTKFVSYKDIKKLMADLKLVYAAPTEETALNESVQIIRELNLTKDIENLLRNEGMYSSEVCVDYENGLYEPIYLELKHIYASALHVTINGKPCKHAQPVIELNMLPEEYMAYYYDFFDRYNNDKRIKRKYGLREEIIYSSQSLVEDMKSIIDKIVRIYEIEEV